MSGFWLVCGILMLSLGNRFLGAGYLLFGIAGLVAGYVYKDKKDEFIEWDDKGIYLKELYNAPVFYNWENIDDIRISNSNFTIISGAANGIMVGLKGYEEDDILRLQTIIDQAVKTSI